LLYKVVREYILRIEHLLIKINLNNKRRQSMKHNKFQSGFTLIELIAVMVILAILAAVVIPRITSVQEGAYESNVVNMYGAIRNYVSNEALRNAVSGGRGMETYTNPDNENANYYLDLWIKDYDADKWTQTCDADGGNTANTANNAGTPGTPGSILFKYEPHGVGQSVLKDNYWIEYFPATSVDAANDGYDYDTFELIAYKDRTNADGNAAGEQDDLVFTRTAAGRALERQISGAVQDGP